MTALRPPGTRPVRVHMAHVWIALRFLIQTLSWALDTGQPLLPDLRRQHRQLLVACTLFGSARLHLLFTCIVDNC